MNKTDRYRIHVDSFLRLTEFLGEWSHKDDIILDVPNIEGLDDAVCKVNEACGIALRRKQECEFEDFIANQFSKIKQFIESGEKNADKAKSLMAETANFYKGKRK